MKPCAWQVRPCKLIELLGHLWERSYDTSKCISAKECWSKTKTKNCRSKNNLKFNMLEQLSRSMNHNIVIMCWLFTVSANKEHKTKLDCKIWWPLTWIYLCASAGIGCNNFIWSHDLTIGARASNHNWHGLVWAHHNQHIVVHHDWKVIITYY